MACAASCSTPTASSSSRRSRCRASIEAVAALDARGIPFRVVTNFSQLHRDSLAAWFEKGGVGSTPTGSSPGRRRQPRTRPQPMPDVRCSSSPRPTRAASSTGSELLSADEADAAPAGHGRRGRHRRRRRRAVVPEHGRRVPARPRRRRAPRDAPQPVVADARGADPRCRRLRRRARVRDWPASAGRSASRPRTCSARPSPGCARTSASACRAPPSRWSATTSAADVAAAQRVGLRGILVLSGKTRRADAERAAPPPDACVAAPDGIAATLADVVAALD